MVSNRKKNIIIFEISTDIDFVYTLAVLSIKSGFRVTIFTTPELWKLMLPLLKKYLNHIKLYLYNDVKIILHNLKKYAEHEDSVLILNTIHHKGFKFLIPFLFFSVKKPMLIVFDRTYYWFEIVWDTSFIRDIIRFFLLRFVILKKFQGAIINANDDFSYLYKHHYQKKVINIPWYLLDKESKPASLLIKDKKIIQFGIVGFIDEIRRNYKGALVVFERLWEKGYKQFHLDIIGNPCGHYGKEIIKICKVFKQKGYPITFTGKFLNTSSFIQRVADCDCLIHPMNIKYYPRTQSSSIITEQIRLKKIAILPQEYQVPELKSSTLYYYDIQDMEQVIIKNFNSADKIKKLKIAAKYNANKFVFEKYIKKFQKFILK